MRKFKFYAGLGYYGADREEIVEIKDDCTEEEVREFFEIWLSEHLDAGYKEIEEGE